MIVGMNLARPINLEPKDERPSDRGFPENGKPILRRPVVPKRDDNRRADRKLKQPGKQDGCLPPNPISM